MIAIAQTKLQQYPEIQNLKFSAGEIFQLDTDKKYDAILCLNVLHLITNRTPFYRAVQDRLTENGVFIVTTPCLGGRFKWLIRLMSVLLVPLGLMPAVSLFTIEQHQTEITKQGFSALSDWCKGDGSNHFMVSRRIPDKS